MDQPTVVLCNVPDDLAARLRQAMSVTTGRWRFLAAGSHEEMIRQLGGKRPAGLIVRPSADGAEAGILRATQRLCPGLPTALVVPTSKSTCYSLLQTYGAAGALPPETPLTDIQLRLFLERLTDPAPEPGIAAIFPPGQTVHTRNITETSLRADVLQELVHDFEACDFLDSYDLQLAFEEVFNNALLHAFRSRRNQVKYTSHSGATLDEEDTVTLEWAVWTDPLTGRPGYGALGMTDNQGLLAPARIWDRFYRQTSLRGILDTNGRGLYLVHLLARLLLVTVWPGQRTQVVALFDPANPNQEKPILVRAIPPAL
jgi:hypothetical protein